MSHPAYLRELVAEAAAYMEKEEASPCEAAYVIASRHNDLATPLGGDGRRDNLDVLKDVRDAHGICTDELESYMRDTSGDGDPLVEALVRRSLEEYIHEHLSVDGQTNDDAIVFAPGVERDGKIGDVWQYSGEQVFIPITDTEDTGK